MDLVFYIRFFLGVGWDRTGKKRVWFNRQFCQEFEEQDNLDAPVCEAPNAGVNFTS